MRLSVRFKRWLMDQYCRDEVVAFAREMVQQQVTETQKQLRENAELRITLWDERAKRREEQHKCERLADELRSVRANYEGWRHEAKRLGARGLEA